MTYQTAAPYGADVDQEIRALLDMDQAAFVSRAMQIVSEDYGLRAAQLERLHVGAGLALTFKADEGRFVLKSDVHDNPLALQARLERLKRLRECGLALPAIRPTRSRGLFVDFGARGVKAYLMRFVEGRPASDWSDKRAVAAAGALACMHRLGLGMPRQPGRQVTLDDFWPEAMRSIARLDGRLAGEVLSEAQALIESAPSTEGLSWTHVHGDPRLCHFLFDGDELSALIDHDDGGWGHRVGDVAYTAVSHPDPADVGFLEPAQIQGWLEHYHAVWPLNEADLKMLPYAMTGLVLFELEQMLDGELEDDQKIKATVNRVEKILGSIFERRFEPSRRWSEV